MQLLLQGRGFDVRAYASGDALLNGAAADPDCLVSDFRLAGVDGIELLAALRHRGWTRPAVLVTGFPSADIRERASEAGYSMVFEKPLRERSLVEAVSRLTRCKATN